MIKKLADFYRGFTVFLFWIFVAVAGLGGFLILKVFGKSSAFLSELLPGGVLVGFGLVGIIAVGATAILIDIMDNIRALREKSDGAS